MKETKTKKKRRKKVVLSGEMFRRPCQFGHTRPYVTNLLYNIHRTSARDRLHSPISRATVKIWVRNNEFKLPRDVIYLVYRLHAPLRPDPWRHFL